MYVLYIYYIQYTILNFSCNIFYDKVFTLSIVVVLSSNWFSDSKHAFAMLNAIHSRFKLVKKCCEIFLCRP